MGVIVMIQVLPTCFTADSPTVAGITNFIFGLAHASSAKLYHSIADYPTHQGKPGAIVA